MRPKKGPLRAKVVGHQVHSAKGLYVGVVEDDNPEYLQVRRRILGVGPVVSEAKICKRAIERVDRGRIILKPTKGEYWQTPDPDAGGSRGSLSYCRTPFGVIDIERAACTELGLMRLLCRCSISLMMMPTTAGRLHNPSNVPAPGRA